MTTLPLERTEVPGVFRRGSRFVVVYRLDGRQRKESVGSLVEARELKRRRDAQAREARRGPLLHDFGLRWLYAYAGTGHDSLREATRREYQRLLVAFALEYFERSTRVADLDRAAVQGFVDWLVARHGRKGRLSDRSIHNALVPLRLVLDAAVAHGLLDVNAASQVVLPRRRAGRAWAQEERRFLTRDELRRLIAEVPPRWTPLFELLGATGLRISEALGLRWSELALDGRSPHLHVRRAVVQRVVVAPKSRHGTRCVPLSATLAQTLGDYRPLGANADDYVFRGRDGAPADPGSLRRRVLVPAAQRAGLDGVGFHTLRHTCAALLIETGLSPLRLQRWMGHHSAAFTLEVYGHLFNDDIGPPLDLSDELAATRQ